MKKLANLLAAGALALALLAAPLAFTGCTTPATTTYKITAVTASTVEAAMAAWGDYVAVYHPGPAAERKVLAAYKTWQSATVTVIDTVKAAKPGDATDQAKVNAAVAAVGAALNGLTAVLAQYGISFQPAAD